MVVNKEDIQIIFIKTCNFNINQYEYGINSSEPDKYATFEEIFNILYDILPGYRNKFKELLEYKQSFVVIPKQGLIYELNNEKIDSNSYEEILHKDMLNNIQKSEYKRNNKNDLIAKSNTIIEKLSKDNNFDFLESIKLDL